MTRKDPRFGTPPNMQTLLQIMRGAAILATYPVWILWQSRRQRRQLPIFEDARRLFRQQREHLEAKFADLAQSQDRSAPRWLDCDFDDEVTLVRHRRTGRVSALVGLTVVLAPRRPVGDASTAGSLGEGSIRGESITRSIGMIRSATAVFGFDGDHWTTEGRTVFNLSPVEMLLIHRRELEMVRPLSLAAEKTS